MSHKTRPVCTCSAHQLAQVGCDCEADPFFWNADDSPNANDSNPMFQRMKEQFHGMFAATDGSAAQ